MKLGADPEVFLLNPTNLQLVSAIGKIGGSKDNPLQIKGMKKGFTLQEDNVALEFGIPPAKARAHFIEHIQSVLEQGHKKAGGLAFSTKASAYFPKEELRHPKAHQFGCEPDFNAYTMKENPRPQLKDESFRTAGGHVHMEMAFGSKEETCHFIKFCDLFLGIPSLFMDTDTERRSLYGGPGAFRYKSYGVEYRTLSNFWIFDPRNCGWVWDNTERAQAAFKHTVMSEDVAERVFKAIKYNNLDQARKLVKEFDLEVL